MKLFSTKNSHHTVDLEQAIFKGLPPDNGLYLPTTWNTLDIKKILNKKFTSFAGLAEEILLQWLYPTLDKSVIKEISYDAFNFEVPLIPIQDPSIKNLHVMELWHGPTLAFKDFGARFMSRLLKYYLKKKEGKIHILVATSGDTGSAIASGFLNIDDIKVTILFPKNKVSKIQQKQLTTYGNNITAIEIDGSFDDCQRLVKTAFLDQELSKKYGLSSANSINIARLIPQSLYYWYAWYQLNKSHKDNQRIVFCTPSGNFGNLCGGIIAQKMGLPVEKFIAATNINDVVPKYLSSGIFEPKPSIPTLSNAMDVGNPSNFQRMTALFDNRWEQIKENIISYSIDEENTKKGIASVYQNFNYLLCPHTAVGYMALQKSQKKDIFSENTPKVLLSTAHPIKFNSVINEIIQQKLQIPHTLYEILNKKESFLSLSKNFNEIKTYIERH